MATNRPQHYPHKARLLIHRGVALVSVLWLVLLLSTVAISLSREMQLTIKTTGIYSHEVQVKAEIEGAVYESIYRLNAGQQNTQLLREFSSHGFEIKLDETQDKTDLNAATLEQIEKLLLSNEIAAYQSLSERIVDFRDRDDESKNGGNENLAYLQAGASYDAKNSEFQHLMELAQIPGMSQDIVAKLAKYITVFGSVSGGRVITLTIGKTLGSTRATANVTVQLTGGTTGIYKILNWDWTAS